MYFQANKLFFWSHRTTLIGLYFVFFLVQFSCISGPGNTFIAASVSYNKTDRAKEKSCVNKKDHTKKSNIRLNKRFQPGIVDGISNTNTDTPVKYICSNNPVKPEEYLLFSFILATSLRGPPSLS